MGFKDTIDEALPGAYRTGLRALRNTDKNKVACGRPRDLTGSVDVDTALRQTLPDDARWDYVLGLRVGAGAEHVVWIEVHPASTGEVSKMLAKLRWLRDWLASSAPALRAMTRPTDGYLWVASGKVAIRPGSPHARALAQSGLKPPREHVVL